MKKSRKLLSVGVATKMLVISLVNTCAAEVILSDSPDMRIQDATNTSVHADGAGQRSAAGVYFIAARVGDVGTVRKAVVLY